MKNEKKYLPENFLSDGMNLINKIKIPPLDDPVKIKIYWFQAHCYKQDSSTFYFKAHKHTFCEAHFVINGTITYKTADKTVEVCAGQFIMIPAQMVHTLLSCSDDFIKLSLSFEVIEKPDNPLSQIMAKNLSHSSPVCACRTDEMNASIDLICMQAKRRMPLSPFAVRNEIFNLISEIYYVTSQNPKKINLITSEDGTTDSRYISAKKFIDDNIFIKLRTNDVAKHVHLSSKQLNRIFLKYGEISVFDYISDQKCLAAKELLLTTDLSLQIISDRLGFSDEFYFNRYFTKKTGITPMKFRKINGHILKNKETGDSQNEML